jgi:hypothetical protein
LIATHDRPILRIVVLSGLCYRRVLCWLYAIPGRATRGK